MSTIKILLLQYLLWLLLTIIAPALDFDNESIYLSLTAKAISWLVAFSKVFKASTSNNEYGAGVTFNFK